jgi:hypothetical protein
MTTLTDFLLARYAEIEAMAREVIADGDADELGRWEWVEYPYEGGSPQPLGSLAESKSGYDPDWSWARLVNRYDPAYVLAECEAKRRIVEEHYYMPRHESRDFGFEDGNCVTCRRQGPCVTLRLLALPYADHPEYDERWRP